MLGDVFFLCITVFQGAKFNWNELQSVDWDFSKPVCQNKIALLLKKTACVFYFLWPNIVPASEQCRVKWTWTAAMSPTEGRPCNFSAHLNTLDINNRLGTKSLIYIIPSMMKMNSPFKSLEFEKTSVLQIYLNMSNAAVFIFISNN